uniref:JmjC domain-containing protein n=1 Tax=Globodera pallida TaxID=36090 RepID=A0A183CGI4_GLOPA
MPDPQKFSVSDVLELIGGERSIEVVDVYEQTGGLKPLKEFIDYYKKPQSERTELWNALSLEFTSTKLAEQVSAPTVVSEIDWIDNVWPKHLFDPPDAAVNNDSSTYPKVQKLEIMYCLMSVATCFTDFHIDFGGTSVWYHILKGEKCGSSAGIGPVKKHASLENLSKNVRLYDFIRATRWIHAVYTPVDSLAFGGNFLHSYAIPMQLRISETEKIIKVPDLKYRFPHFKQIFWCYIASIVRRSTSRIYQKKLTAEAPQLLTDAEEICYNESLGNKVDVYNPIQLGFDLQDKPKFFTPTQRYNLDYLRKLSPFEIFGLESLAHYADKLLRSTQPEVIEGITRPCHLVKEFRAVISKINELGLVSTQRSTAETAQSDDKIRQLEEENRELKSALLAKPELPAQVRSEQAGKEDGRGGDQGGGFGRPEI